MRSARAEPANALGSWIQLEFRRTLSAPALLAALLLAGCAGAPSELLTLPSDFSARDRAREPIRSGAKTSRGGIPIAGGPARDEQVREAQGTGELVASPPPRTQTAEATATRDGISLNLADAPVQEAARAILGDILKVTYVISERVKGTVTLQTARPVSKEALLDIFDATLRLDGNALVGDGGVYKIVPQGEALAAGAPLRGRGTTMRRGAGIGVQIVPLRHVGAGEIERVLKPLAPQGGIVRVDTVRNIVVLAGTRAEIAQMLDVVSVFDIDTMRGMSIALFPIEAGDPDAIAQELDAVFQNDRDGPARGIVRFVPNRRLKSLLVISSRPDYLDRATTWLRRIEKVSRTTQNQFFTYHVQNRPAAELAQLLQRIYAAESQAAGAAPSAGLARPASPLETGSIIAPGPTAVATPAGSAQPVPAAPVPAPASPAPAAVAPVAAPSAPDPLGGASAAGDATGRAGTAAAGEGGRPRAVSIVPDETNNALLISATESEYRRMLRILERIDVVPNQILLETTIAEVTLNDRLKFGLRWFFESGKSQFKLTDDAVLGAVAPTFPGFSYFLDSANVKVALNALSSVTDVNIVSSPTLMVLDNKKATLQVGAEVPVATQQAQTVTAPGSPVINAISFRNTGVILSITPRISDRGRVLLDIEQEVSEAVATDTSKIDSPTIQQRRVRTTVAVQDGDSLALAGFMQDRSDLARSQVPILGRLPVVGNLFKDKDDRIRRTELLVVITPRVMRDANHVRAVTEEFRDKINLSLRPQRHSPPDKREDLHRLAR
jgi:general secretion pathway protein D